MFQRACMHLWYGAKYANVVRYAFIRRTLHTHSGCISKWVRSTETEKRCNWRDEHGRDMHAVWITVKCGLWENVRLPLLFCVHFSRSLCPTVSAPLFGSCFRVILEFAAELLARRVSVPVPHHETGGRPRKPAISVQCRLLSPRSSVVSVQKRVRSSFKPWVSYGNSRLDGFSLIAVYNSEELIFELIFSHAFFLFFFKFCATI